jgi:phage tail-like protein
MAITRTEFQGSFFSLEIDKVKIALFTSCTGISIEVDVIEHPTGQLDGKHYTQKIPGGRAKYGDVTLKRGLTPNDELQKWFDKVANAQEFDRSTGAITVLSREMKPVAKFNFVEMWPTKLSIGDLSAKSTEVLVEELTLAHEGVKWE